MGFGCNLRALFVFLCLLAVALGAAGKAPAATGGRLALQEVPSEPLYLTGDWGFAWQAFVDPHWTTLPTRAVAPVPSSWNHVSADSKPEGENGWGSYVLEVQCPAGQSLALEALPQRTADRLFVNGTPVAAHGRPGPSAAQSWPAVLPRVPITREFACPLRITLHVSNFDHRAGGFVRPLSVAPADVLARARESRIIFHSALVSTYLLTSVVALIFFLVRRRESTPLLYGLFCVATGVYTDMIGERLLLRSLPEALSWVAYMRIEYLSWIASMGLFFLTLRGLFPAEIHRRAAHLVVGTLAVAAVAVLALPPAIYSYVAVPGQLIAVIVAVYVAMAMVRAQARSPVDARVLLAGMLAVLVAFVADFVLLDVPGPDRKFAPFGFALFLLSPAVVLGRRLSRALNAEERSRTLEENARLREDVERISRHDLKTPLHSILGVTRVLADDARLPQEQQQLVGIVQRSALRMLEMVNLSLGLVKMEMGSYDFRPHAVDLREVAAHVLLDLASHAAAHKVTLDLQDGPGDGAYVLAEELLCYSIVANLVKNAVEAAGPGNRVTLALRRGKTVALSVHNPGVVDPEVRSRFFQKYVTRRPGGTGLGAYSALLMARAQKGDLVLDTDPERGTSLTLTLPATDGEALTQRVLPAPQAVGTLGSTLLQGDLLVVDDDDFTRAVTPCLLPSSLRIATASGGAAAMEAMGCLWPRYLVIDMQMPVVDGIETVRWVRMQEIAHRKPRCRIVMVSGNDDPAAADRAFAAGADAFLPKPASAEALVSALLGAESSEAGTPAAAAGSAPAIETPLPLLSHGKDGSLVVSADWKDVYPGFLRMQCDAAQAMAQALETGDRGRLEFLAHRATGSLALMGLAWASAEARTLQADARDAALDMLRQRVERLNAHLDGLRVAPA